MKTSLTIDRFEGEGKEVAVLLTDDGTQVNVPRALLPRGARAGDVLTVSIERDPAATRRAADRTRKVQEELTKGDTGGDLKL